MNILIHTGCNLEFGMGHLYRMQALSQEAVTRHHKVWVASDTITNWPGIVSVTINPGKLGDLQLALSLANPDWVVIDVPGPVPEKFLKFARKKARVCLVDGVGHQTSKTDLVISQGPEGEYKAPDYLLLRPGLFRYKWNGLGFRPLVWGGGADPMGLLPAYCGAFPDSEAFLLLPRFGPGKELPEACRGGHRWIVNQTDEGLFGMMATCGRLITSTGMICWESSGVLGVPTYAFSRSERHLKTALAMQEMGYLLAWPKVGLPGRDEFKEFISQPFRPTGKLVDGNGPGRVLDLLEKKG